MTSEHRPIRRCVVTYCGRSPDQVLQLGVTELQADDVIQLPPLRRRRLVVTRPLGHGHLRPLLCTDVHHVNHTSAAWKGGGGAKNKEVLRFWRFELSRLRWKKKTMCEVLPTNILTSFTLNSASGILQKNRWEVSVTLFGSYFSLHFFPNNKKEASKQVKKSWGKKKKNNGVRFRSWGRVKQKEKRSLLYAKSIRLLEDDRAPQTSSLNELIREVWDTQEHTDIKILVFCLFFSFWFCIIHRRMLHFIQKLSLDQTTEATTL